MPAFVAERAPADLLDIFGAYSPVAIPLAFIHRLLQGLLPTLPGFLALPPDSQADHRMLVMHQVAACLPGDTMEAQLAIDLVAVNAHAMESFRLAALPGAEPKEALRHSRHAARLMAMHAQMLTRLERRQTARRKAEEIPTERAGYWFKDISVPLPPENPPPREQWTTERSEAHRPPDATADANAGNDPMHHETPVPAAATREVSLGAAEASQPGAHVLSGDALYRFASRRLDPNRSDAEIWAQCDAEAAVEQAALADEQARRGGRGAHAP